ncbi:MAG: transglutaminase domain-containing protein [Bacteroidia bacterium]
MFQRAVILIFLLQFALSNLFSQQDLRKFDYSAVDQHVLKVSRTYESDIYKLVDKLAIFDQKHLNFRAAFFWIASNIKYDCNDLSKADKYKKSQKWPRTLADTSAICGGYANLLKAICDRMNIECEVIRGKSKGGWSDLENRTTNSHAWNRVKLNGQWYLMDPTWASGYIDDKTKSYKASFNPHYFLADPNLMILNHYPKETKWQLLESPVTYTEFIRSPVIIIRDDSTPLESYYPLNGIVTTGHKQKLKFSYSLLEQAPAMAVKMQIAKRSAYLKAKGYNSKNSEIVEQTLQKGEGNNEYFTLLKIEEPGEYFVTIWLNDSVVFRYYYRLR